MPVHLIQVRLKKEILDETARGGGKQRNLLPGGLTGDQWYVQQASRLVCYRCHISTCIPEMHVNLPRLKKLCGRVAPCLPWQDHKVRTWIAELAVSYAMWAA